MSNNLAIRPQTFADLQRFGEMAAQSGMVPQSYRGKPADIILAIQMGSELGLAPFQSLQNIACINGRPTVWGDAMLGLVRASGVCKSIVEKVEGEGDAMVAVCIAHRTDDPNPITAAFSVEQAKRAGLWGKAGPWQQYPRRMLQMRARGFALRDAFPDVLRGLITAEEAEDIPPERGPVVDHVDTAPPPNPTAMLTSGRDLAESAVAEFAHRAADCVTVDALYAILDSDKARKWLGKLEANWPDLKARVTEIIETREREIDALTTEEAAQ